MTSKGGDRKNSYALYRCYLLANREVSCLMIGRLWLARLVEDSSGQEICGT